MPFLQAEAIVAMTNAFSRLEAAIAPPQQVPCKDSFVYRYTNKGLHEALVQKLARCISGLNAVVLLLSAGYVQEVGVILRTLDEIQEDILFLASAVANVAPMERHEKYLEAFYAEVVFSRPEGSLDTSKPNLVPRKKIRAHTANVLGEGVNVSQFLSAGESLSAAYSGFVHAASENIMDMYGGNPPHFYVNGMHGTPRIATFVREAENYVYRGLMATTVAAMAFGDRPLVDALNAFRIRYESANGHIPPGTGKAGT